MSQYLPLVMLGALGVAFALASFGISRLLAPRRDSAAKRAPYECGIVPTRDVAQRFPVRFYLVAMIFIILDIEIIFLYPWAIAYGDLGGFGLGEMAVFTTVVIICLAYLLSNGALDWGPRRGKPDIIENGPPDASIKRVPKPAVSRGE